MKSHLALWLSLTFYTHIKVFIILSAFQTGAWLFVKNHIIFKQIGCQHSTWSNISIIIESYIYCKIVAMVLFKAYLLNICHIVTNLTEFIERMSRTELSMSMVQLSKCLKISQVTASQSATRGEKIVKGNKIKLLQNNQCIKVVLSSQFFQII